MDRKVQSESTLRDKAIILLAVGVFAGGVWAYYAYPEVSLLLRVLGVLVGVALAVLIALQSAQGQALWSFIHGSRVELLKVVWPTREEALQTTGAGFIFAVLMGLFFWLLDLFLLWFTRFLTGQGG